MRKEDQWKDADQKSQDQGTGCPKCGELGFKRLKDIKTGEIRGDLVVCESCGAPYKLQGKRDEK